MGNALLKKIQLMLPKQQHEQDVLLPVEEAHLTAKIIGDLLQEMRNNHNHTIDYVAAQIKIRSSYVEALELGDLSKLPDYYIGLGFLRTYCQFYNMYHEAEIAKIKSLLLQHHNKNRLKKHATLHEGSSSTPRKWLVLLSLIIMIALYSGWGAHYHKTTLFHTTSKQDLTPFIIDADVKTE